MEYIPASQIAELTGKHRSSILRRAKREGWSEKKEGKRILLRVSDLPDDIRNLITTDKIEEIDNTSEDTSKNTEEPANEKPQQDKKIAQLLKELDKKSIILMGKQGIGKSYTIRRLLTALADENILFFTEPPTAKTILLNIAMATGQESKDETKKDLMDRIKDYRGDRIILAIDRLENITPSAIEVLGSLMELPWFRFIGAGHLGKKKRYNSVWMKAKGVFIKPLSRQESKKLVDSIWPEGDSTHKRIIVDRARGIPGEIVKMATDAKQGIMPEETERYFDFTPVILVIATIGLAVRVIGYGYQSAESYIIGGIIAAVFWGIFWIYRGYVGGWFGTEKKE